MADAELLRILYRGPDAWNQWRNRSALRSFDLSATLGLRGRNLAGADFSGVDLRWTPLIDVDCSGCNFRNADLMGTNLRGSRFTGADFTQADLQWAHFRDTNLKKAILRCTLLRGAVLIRTDAAGADFTGSKVFGISVWNLKTDNNTKQSDLVITPDDQPTITVDDVEVAQFVYLLLNREKLRNVLETLTSKAVLILGRFTPERKRVLEQIANKLRQHNLLPIVFDFEKSASRDFTETIKTLAGLCMFVIADITNPRSAPLELQAAVPDYQIPFVTLIQEGEEPFSMFNDLWTKYGNWVLPPVSYPSPEKLIQIFEKAVLDRAWRMHQDLRRAKAERVTTLSWQSFLEKEDNRGSDAV